MKLPHALHLTVLGTLVNGAVGNLVHEHVVVASSSDSVVA